MPLSQAASRSCSPRKSPTSSRPFPAVWRVVYLLSVVSMQTPPLPWPTTQTSPPRSQTGRSCGLSECLPPSSISGECLLLTYSVSIRNNPFSAMRAPRPLPLQESVQAVPGLRGRQQGPWAGAVLWRGDTERGMRGIGIVGQCDFRGFSCLILYRYVLRALIHSKKRFSRWRIGAPLVFDLLDCWESKTRSGRRLCEWTKGLC